MATGHPHLLSIGDWVMVGGPKYFGADEPATPFEVVEVTGIVEREPWRYDIPVFVSEYQMPQDFAPIAVKGKRAIFDAHNNSTIKAEHIFVQRRFADRYRCDLFI